MIDQVKKVKGIIEVKVEEQTIGLKFGIAQESINCELEGLKDDKEGMAERARRVQSGSPSAYMRYFYSGHLSYARLYKKPELSYDEFTALMECIEPEDLTKAIEVITALPEDPNPKAP